jgi:hypothetical protein
MLEASTSVVDEADTGRAVERVVALDFVSLELTVDVGTEARG